MEDASALVNGYAISSEIMTNIMLVNYKRNNIANVNMTFMCKSRLCDESARCVFWNTTLEMWSSEGCWTEVTSGVTRCICGHLTSYAILMSASESLIDSKNEAILSYITNVGLGISMASLSLCITLQTALIQGITHVTACYRHVIILNISLCLLLSNISFLAGGIIHIRDHEEVCFVLTFCAHVSLLAFLFWTLVQTLFLVSRLVFVFHHVTKREFTALAVILGYACPVIIACITYFHFYPLNRYRKKDVCWLESSSGAAYAFTVPTIIILLGNFLGLAVVIRTLMRPSVSDGPLEDEEVVKKLVKAVVFCTPQFGLTWAIGIPLLVDGNSLVLNYLFVLLNPLQVFNCNFNHP
ncbi:hypothetical protein NDU88_011087 [Pleurodeles waltl]|uniref:Uncharacterized protein n=1 Tax=Pleurodeles waltl TaxID=8319 RepID=A0AAV7S170_PLEWA|nr:hypothetical protein NDU88_011087 [Pleurodeles waltl]